jgi:large subunit ribosomal protein L10
MKASLNQAAYLFVAPLSQAARTIDALRLKKEAEGGASAASDAGTTGEEPVVAAEDAGSTEQSTEG